VKFFAVLLAISMLVFVALGAPGKRIVKANDQVSIYCDEEAALNREYTITKDGFIVMRFVGAIQVAGMTEEAAAGKIAQALVDEKILQKASVELNVLASKSGVISYSGAVQNSGSIPPKAGFHLSDLVQIAKPIPNANLQKVKITTAAGNEFIVNYAAFTGADNLNNPELRSGDSVFFDYTNQPAPIQQPMQQPIQQQPHFEPEHHADNPRPLEPTHQEPQRVLTEPEKLEYVEVMGAVEKSRTIRFEPGMTLSQAIERCGILKDSDLRNVRVDRKIDGDVRTYREDISRVHGGFSGDFPLRGGDIIHVPEQGHSRGPSRAVKIGAMILLGLLILHP
jgi:protein involved in polysaccharide export with SLBB domain